MAAAKSAKAYEKYKVRQKNAEKEESLKEIEKDIKKLKESTK